MKRFSVFLLLVILICSGCSKPTESSSKQAIQISGSKAVLTYEDFINYSEIILLGKVVRITDQYFTAPNGTEVTSDGTLAMNAYVTEYELEITQIYKGEYSKDTILVKTYNGESLTPDQFLYGEDEDAAVISRINDFYLEEGKECLLGLYYFERGYLKDGECGYNVTYGEQGYFTRGENETFTNALADKPFEIELSKLAEDCKTDE